MKLKLLSLTMLSLLLAGFGILTGCKEEAQDITLPVKPKSTCQLIDNQVLRSAELELVWAHAMPLSGDELLRDFMIIEDRLYAVSTHNYLLSLDLHQANPVYAWKLAPDSFKMCGLRKYDDNIYSIITTDLIIMDGREGTKRMSKRLSFGPLCAPVRNDDFYYIAGTDQRIHVLRASDLVQLFEASANDNSNITCVNAENNSVIFATDAGNVVAMLPGEAEQIWKFSAEGGINSPVVRNNSQIIFSGKDAYVYVVGEEMGKLIWKYLTAALLTEAPVVTQRYVYQHVGGKGLLAIDRETGKLAWQLPDGAALLSEKGTKVYVMTKDRNLVVMDTKKKQKIAQIELPMISRWISNVDGDKIYLADDFGRIVCIKPIEY